VTVKEEKSRKEKKKLPVVQFHQNQYKLSDSLHFSMCSTPADGRKQASHFVTCREHLLECIRAFYTKGKTSISYYNYGSDPMMATDKFRFLLGRSSFIGSKARETFRDNLFSGKRALNIYEGIAGWNLSKITTVKYDLGCAWLITGPVEWMYSPALISMAALILRVATKWGPIDTSSEEALVDWFAANANTNEHGDKKYLAECAPAFRVVIENWKKLFSKTIEENWPATIKNGYSFHGCSGIYALCLSTHNNIDDALKARFNKLWEKHNKFKKAFKNE